MAGQDNLRVAMRRISRDLANAMIVYLDNRPLNLWHYDKYVVGLDTAQPDPAAVPIPLQIDGSCIDLVLPKHRYYCPWFNHHLLDTEVSSLEARDDCPRHPGAPLECSRCSRFNRKASGCATSSASASRATR